MAIPELHAASGICVTLHVEAHGQDASVPELVPTMLAAFVGRSNASPLARRAAIESRVPLQRRDGNSRGTGHVGVCFARFACRIDQVRAAFVAAAGFRAV